ncbi:DUF4357 domain-containing protein [bacterium]|nr:DUF4357 domain-containing protein [bacterium]
MIDVSLKKEVAIVDITKKPITLEEEVKEMRLTLDAMSKMFLLIRQENAKKNKKTLLTKDDFDQIINSDGIPINTFYIGYTEKTTFPHILIVNEKGKYVIGDKAFTTLSAAAEHVTGEKKDGWSFWQTIDGVELKDIFK